MGVRGSVLTTRVVEGAVIGVRGGGIGGAHGDKAAEVLGAEGAEVLGAGGARCAVDVRGSVLTGSYDSSYGCAVSGSFIESIARVSFSAGCRDRGCLR